MLYIKGEKYEDVAFDRWCVCIRHGATLDWTKSRLHQMASE